MMIMIIKIISTFLLGNIVIAAKAPAPSTKLLETVNCHFDTADVGCSMGFEQSWTEARNQGSHRINILRRNTTTLDTLCDPKDQTITNQCGKKGECNLNTSVCECNDGYIHEIINYTGTLGINRTIIINPCHYEGTSKKFIFFLSIFLGLCGCDWCFLSLGVNSAYACLGLFKFFTMGGLGVWWIYDIFALYFTAGPHDGWGMELYDDLTGTGAPTGLTAVGL
jgi:hypothetical protein